MQVDGQFIITRPLSPRKCRPTRTKAPDGPPRKYYHLTDLGEAALDDFRKQWAEFVRAVDDAMGAPL